jgi:hypothetical protein
MPGSTHGSAVLPGKALPKPSAPASSMQRPDQQDHHVEPNVKLALKRPRKRQRPREAAATGAATLQATADAPSTFQLPSSTDSPTQDDRRSPAARPRSPKTVTLQKDTEPLPKAPPRAALPARDIAPGTSVVEQAAGVSLPLAVVQAANTDFVGADTELTMLPHSGAFAMGIDAAMAAAGVAPRFAKAARDTARRRYDTLAEALSRDQETAEPASHAGGT